VERRGPRESGELQRALLIGSANRSLTPVYGNSPECLRSALTPRSTFVPLEVLGYISTMSETIREALDKLIKQGERVLAGVREPGNIDQHDIWISAAKVFMAINEPDLEQRLNSISPKYSNAILREPNGRAAQMLIMEQLEVVRLARYRQADRGGIRASNTDEQSTWVADIDKSIEIKPGIFGVTIDIKGILKALIRRFRSSAN